MLLKRQTPMQKSQLIRKTLYVTQTTSASVKIQLNRKTLYVTKVTSANVKNHNLFVKHRTLLKRQALIVKNHNLSVKHCTLLKRQALT